MVCNEGRAIGPPINIITIMLIDFMPLCEPVVDRVSIDPVTTPLSVNKLLLIFY